MILHFPQWQGIGFPTNVNGGAQRLYDAIGNKGGSASVPVASKHALTIENGVYGYSDVYDQAKSALDILHKHKPKRVLTIGGDCGVEVAPSAYLNHLYGGDVQIFWFDAHADINSPDTSFSAHFHGMPLGYLLGEAKGDAITDLIAHKITPDQIAFAGLRSIDPPEEDYIKAHNIGVYDFASLHTAQKKYKHAIVHVDTDVLDAKFYRECATPTTRGVDPDTLIATLEKIFETYDVVGGTITEYAPGNAENKKPDVAFPMIRDILMRGLKADDTFWV